MIILGLNFGHDASISIIRDGEVVLCFERERHVRVKKAMTLSPEDITICLEDAGITIDEVEYCTLTSTQLFEYVLLDRENLSIEINSLNGNSLPCTMTDKLNVSGEEFLKMGSGWLEEIFQRDYHIFHQLLPDGKNIINKPQNVFPSFEHYVYAGVWDKVTHLADIGKTDYSPFVDSDDVSHGFHYPATVHVYGRAIPAFVFAHHYAHMAYSYYDSPYDEAALFSHDGGGGGGNYGCGLFGYGKGNRIFPLTPHHFDIGEIYDLSSLRLGFYDTSMAGKLMGLSAYGKPRFFSYDYVGNWYDTQQSSAQDWVDHCERRAREMGYDMEPFGERSRLTEPVNADFAASTQKLLEETMLKATYALHGAVASSIGHVPAICLTGGVALNCPANSRIENEGPYDSVYIPPASTDQGLSMGSALALYYNILGHDRNNQRRASPLRAYLGLERNSLDRTIEAALEDFRDSIKVEAIPDTALAAAEDLHQDRVIAWFEGRSEIGPRALGHRSIVANPKNAENWPRVNKIKSRELWRPFAPAVLAEEADSYFDQIGSASYFMLLNANVRSRELPAITHVDGSARVQIVSPECGRFYELLKAFKHLAGIPVVLNTSLNGPGEPIIEAPIEAIRFLLNTDIDALYMGKFRITRESA